MNQLGAVRQHTHALRFLEDCVLEMDEKGADGLFAVAGDTLAETATGQYRPCAQ